MAKIPIDLRTFAVPILILFVIVFALTIAFPLLSDMTGVSNNMSVAIDSVGIEISSALPFIFAIIIIGLATQLKGQF